LIFVFGDCELDLDMFELRRAGRRCPIEPQVFDLLAMLVRERRRVVPKEELLDTVWAIDRERVGANQPGQGGTSGDRG
jgi:DNA-binding winged helix-turn-helix (wHTH) protein